jgi:hypothetical protein
MRFSSSFFFHQTTLPGALVDTPRKIRGVIHISNRLRSVLTLRESKKFFRPEHVIFSNMNNASPDIINVLCSLVSERLYRKPFMMRKMYSDLAENLNLHS